jgi:hypothetical protein
LLEDGGAELSAGCEGKAGWIVEELVVGGRYKYGATRFAAVREGRQAAVKAGVDVCSQKAIEPALGRLSVVNSVQQRHLPARLSHRRGHSFLRGGGAVRDAPVHVLKTLLHRHHHTVIAMPKDGCRSHLPRDADNTQWFIINNRRPAGRALR